ncbi:MAG TPA: peptidoglycan recognition protein [Mycobacteriales bacterium]
MRPLLRTAVVLAVTPVALALPVASRPAAKPHPVRASVREHAVRGVAAVRDAVAGPGVGRPLALTAPAAAAPFEALGVTWAADRAVGDVSVLARVRQAGAWTAWHALDADPDHEPDAAEAAGARGGTAPWYAGRSDGWQVRLAVVGGRAPRDVRVSLVDPGSSAADAEIGRSPVFGASAEAAPARPSIVTRAQWGADESLRDGSPDYSDTIRMGFVHHTDTSNSYSSTQAAAMVRSVYAFHTQSRGWSDIGYNFLVDKYGRVFEGRYGGVDRPVIGAHTGGFNTDTFGVALLGNFASYVPPPATLSALQRTFAWKFSLHYVNPLATTVLTSRGGSKYETGTQVRFNNVSGHRDAGLTACPGAQTYSRLPSIRSGIKAAMGASLYTPSVSAPAPLYLSSGVTVRSGVAGSQSWQLDVRDARGVVRRTYRGTASGALAVTWDLRDATGALVVPDRYALTLQSWTATTRALPWQQRVDVASPLPDGATLGNAGVPFAVVESGRTYPASAPLLNAVRQAPPLPAFPGPKAALGLPVAGPRDGTYVRNAAGTAWLVVDGARRPATSSVATALGLGAARLLPDAVLSVAPVGTPWTRTDAHPDGVVVTSADTAWRIESGVRRPFTSPASRAAWAKSLAVAAATPADLALPLGRPLGPPEGVVLQRVDGSFVVVSDGAWRPVGAAALGYASAVAATTADLSAWPLGEPLGDRHPSGTLLRTGPASYVEVLGGTRRAVDPALVAADPRVPLAPVSNEVNLLVAARWSPPNGLAGLGADGLVRVVDNGRLVTVARNALGYGTVALPALEAADFGPLPVAAALANPARHPAGSLVTDGTAVWLLDASARRPVAASLVATYLGRPALPATAADLALPAGPAAPPANGAWLRTPDGARWLVQDGVRRAASAAATRRLGYGSVPTMLVAAEELTASTVLGPAVP